MSNNENENGDTAPGTASPDAPIKKPSLISQVAPYLVAAAILTYVFTGLSSNVVNEPHRLAGSEWSELEKRGVKKNSVKLSDAEGTLEYCRAGDGDEGEDGCPRGGDFEFRPESDSVHAAIRRAPQSRIPDGSMVSANYVQKIKIGELWALVREADLSWFIPIMVLHVLIFSLGDTLSFGGAYRFFNVPGMKFRELLECRLAPYIIQIGIAPLAEVLFPLYMWRVKKARVTHILSTNLWTMILDLTSTMTIITAAVIINLKTGLVPAIGTTWLIGCILFWAGWIVALILRHTPVQDRVLAAIAHADAEGRDDQTPAPAKTVPGATTILRTFFLARWHHMVRIYAVRFAIGLSALLSNYIALRALGVSISLPLALVCFPIIVFSVFMPISVGGYGGTQLVAWFLIVQMGKTGTADQVLAYSFLWVTGFAVGRGLVGIVFIRGFWKRTFPQGFSFS